MEGLLDFGRGAYSGAQIGYKVGGGNPYVTGGVALLNGAVSLFGGSNRRRMERESDRISLAMDKQDMRLNEFKLSAAMRDDKAEREAMAKRKLFGEMMGKWFAGRGQASTQTPMQRPA